MKRYRMRVLAFSVIVLAAAISLATTGGCSDDSSTGSTAEPASDVSTAGDNAGSTDTGAEAKAQPLLFGIGMHIEPLGAKTSSLTGQPQRSAGGPQDYNRPELFNRHVNEILTVAGIVEQHKGKLTVQAQTAFTSVALSTGNNVLADLASRGHEIGLHFHEDAHLGRNPDSLPASTWCAVMSEEIDLLKQSSGVKRIRYWSGGNLYPGLLDAASCAGLDVNSDWKNPEKQSTADELIGTNPWRPAGGTDGEDVSQFARHDPAGPVVFLPEGQYTRNDYAAMRRSQDAGGDEAYFQFLKDSLMNSLATAQAEHQTDPTRVNVFHFTVHPGEFKGDPQHPYEVIDRFLAEVVDPLVASGQLQWATFSQMADSYAAWEQAHPGVDPKTV